MWLRRCEWRRQFPLAGEASPYLGQLLLLRFNPCVSNLHSINSLASVAESTQLPAPRLSTTRLVLRGVARAAVNATT